MASAMTGTAIPTFVTTIYGAKYAPFLGPLLHSIDRVYPGATTLVLWQDLPAREVEILKAAHPAAEFMPVSLELTGDVYQRIPQKMHAWLAAARRFPERLLAFVDCDTLLVRKFEQSPNLLEGTWDVIDTWKEEPYPLNTGVMLARNGETAEVVFAEMLRRIERILADKGEMALAVGCSGAADQHALRQMIGYVNYAAETTRDIGGRRVTFRGVACATLNQTNCGPVEDGLRLIHYKTGWHPILLEGAGFTKNRPEAACAAMFRLWRDTDAEAGAAVARRLTFAGATRAQERFATHAGGYEERGILHSEMLAACGVCELMGIDTVIESGRARGQSTRQLASYFGASGTRIISLELVRDADAEYAERALADFKDLELRYGNIHEVLPGLMEELRGRRVALLCDGPKGLEAIRLIQDGFGRWEELKVAFLHDVRKETSQREFLEPTLARAGSAVAGMRPTLRAFCTDDAEYVERFGGLDRACLPSGPITMHTWRPYMKGEDRIPSYGPTLAVLLPKAGRPEQFAEAALNQRPPVVNTGAANDHGVRWAQSA